MIARRLLPALVGLSLLAPAALVTAVPAAAATTVKVVEFNAAEGKGKACPNRCLAPIVDLLPSADVVALQEVCLNTLDSFAKTHDLHKTFSAQSTADAACNGHDRGNAVLSRYALDEIPPVVLTAPNTVTTNTFTLLCATVHKPGQRVRACSTHLVSGKSVDQSGQAQQIVDATASARQQGKKVIVAGDFNARPGDTTVSTMSGPFKQKQPSNIGVVYVWWQSGAFSGLTSTAASGGSSDHSVLISTAQV